MNNKQRKINSRKRPPPPRIKAGERDNVYIEHRKKLEAQGVIPPADQALNYGGEKSPVQIAVFLQHLTMGWTVSIAAQTAGIGRRTIEAWRSEDPDFRDAYDEAIDAGTDFIEQEARRRAVDGVDEPVFQQGECVGFKRVYSDSLMQTLLSGRRPEKYGKQRHEHSGPNGGPINYKVDVEFVDG